MLATITVNTLVDENDGVDMGGISLREALTASVPDDMIDFAPGLTADGPATILLTRGQLVLNKSLSIVGPGAQLLTIDASGNDPSPDVNNGNGSRVFFISDGAVGVLRTVSIAGLTLTGGDSNGAGGAIFTAEHLAISASVITGNNSTSAGVAGGGGIYSNNGGASPNTLTLLDTAVTNNLAFNEGGGIRKRYGSLVIEGSTISGNSAGTSGGGLSAADGGVNVQIRNSLVSDNRATGVFDFDGGAGVFVFRGSASIEGSTISGNIASDRGGGIYGYSSTVTVLQSTISGNVGYSAGGGIYNGGNLTVTASTISGNSSSGFGGGVAGYANATITESRISGNSAFGDGGGLGILNRNLTVIDSVISLNSSGNRGGGVMFNGYNRNLFLVNVNLYNNESTYGSGGGVYSSFASNVSITRSTITGNEASFGQGGGIFSAARSTVVSESVIEFNRAFNGGGAWSGYGTFSIVDSTLSGNSADANGGGLYSFGTSVKALRTAVKFNNAGEAGGGLFARYGDLAVTDAAIVGNSAAQGGGVYAGTLANFTVTGSTASGNIASHGPGGGFFVRQSAASIANSTISGNSASTSGGGVYLFASQPSGASISYSTITQNSSNTFGGGLVVVGDSLQLANVILAANFALLAPDGAPVFGALDARYSLIGEASGTGLAEAPLGAPDAHGNLIGGPVHGTIDPQLQFLADNAGPALPDGSRIQTHALALGSPAIDAGDPTAVAGSGAVPEFDQRGTPLVRVADGDHVDGSRIDMGAFEQQTLQLIVDTLADEVDGDLSPGDLSLREALDLANGNLSDGDSIQFSPALAGGTILLTLGTLFIGDSLNLTGLGADLLTLDATGNDPTPDQNIGDGSRVFDVFSNGAVTISGLTLTGGDSSNGGAIFAVGGELTVADSLITGNAAAFSGGGIDARYGSLHVVRTSIAGNVSRYSGGGGISMRYHLHLDVADSTITGNTAASSGGGVSLDGSGDASMVRSTISYNSAVGNGGGIGGRPFGSITLTDVTIAFNSAATGGGIFAYGLTNVTSSVISNNSATIDRGGGIFGGELNVANSTFDSNNAAGDGAGVFATGPAVVTRSMILQNYSSGGNGGGIASQAQLTVVESTIAYNSAGGVASNGGGIHASGSLDVLSSTISSNYASVGGGGVHATPGVPVAVRHSTISLNGANFGGGVFVPTGTLALDHSIVAGNFAAIGPDLTGFIGLNIDARHSLIGDNANTGLAASPTGAPDAKGNLIGPVANIGPLVVRIDMAAMGDFEAGPLGDSFRFEYSVDGAPFQPLFTSAVDESASLGYFMDNGVLRLLDDPLLINGVTMTNDFQTLEAVIPVSGSSIQIRFTANNDGPSEAFAWRNLVIYRQAGGAVIGSAVQHFDFFDDFAAYTADPDYAIAGDMFGIRSRVDQGIPSLPFDVVDDSISIFTGDVQGIVSEFDFGRFFGVVDTVNGTGGDTNSATWTFSNPDSPIDPALGPLTDNGGPTWTHQLLPGSPAIDAGDHAALAGAAGVPQFDQRGVTHSRVFNGDAQDSAAIDIGAYELQTPGSSTDFDANGAVDGGDFLAWQRGFGTPVPAALPGQGDADGDRDVDAQDFAIWSSNWGSPQAATALSAEAALTDGSTAALSPTAIDAAMTYWQMLERPAFRPSKTRLLRAR